MVYASGSRTRSTTPPGNAIRLQEALAQAAFGADGAPSRALEGFCKKNGVSADDVTREADGKGTEYVWAVVRSRGRPAAEVCDLIVSLHSPLFCNTPVGPKAGTQMLVLPSMTVTVMQACHAEGAAISDLRGIENEECTLRALLPHRTQSGAH